MRRNYFAMILVLVALLSACSTTAPTSTPLPKAVSVGKEDGLSFATAIVIHAKDERSGVDAEYAWIDANLPRFRHGGQSLIEQNGKPFDVIHVASANGEERDVYFDISEYFGKM